MVGGRVDGGVEGRSEEAAREVTIKIRRRSCFVAVVGTAGREGGGREVRSTMGVKVRRERRRKRGQKDREGKGEEGGRVVGEAGCVMKRY